MLVNASTETSLRSDSTQRELVGKEIVRILLTLNVVSFQGLDCLKSLVVHQLSSDVPCRDRKNRY